MRPAWRVIADGKDLTEALAGQLLSLTVRDEAGLTSDECVIDLADEGGRIVPPAKGTELDIAMGADGVLTGMGLFLVDEVSLSGPPDIMSIRAHAADFMSALKEKRTRDWHETTLGALIKAIADEHGLSTAIQPAFESIAVAHLDQVEESDLALITRLAGDHGAIAKPIERTLVFAAAGEAKTASGLSLPQVTIPRTDVQTYSLSNAERGQYAGVTARWRDAAAAETRTVRAGDEGTAMALSRLYPDEAAARAAAEGKLKEIQRGEAELSLRLAGRIELQAESPVSVTGLREETGGLWSVISAEHVIDRAGFTSRIRCKRPA